MSIIGSLVALFKADSTQFVSNTKKAHDSLHELHNVGHLATQALGLFGVALGAHALVHGAMHLAEGVFETAHSLTALSEKTGVGVQALSELQFASKMSNVDFEELTASLKKFTVNLAEAATTGKGDAFSGLSALHLNAEQLANDPEAFFKFVQALSEVENQTNRTAIATQVLGAKQALNVLPLAAHRHSMEELRAEAKRLGISLSSEQAAALNEAQHSYVRLQTAVQGLAQTMTVAFAPILEDVSRKLAGQTTALNDNATAWGKDTAAVSESVLWWTAILNTWEGVSLQLEHLAADLQRAGLMAEWFTLKMNFGNATSIDDEIKKNDEWFKSINERWNSAPEAGYKFLDEQFKHIEEMQRKMREGHGKPFETPKINDSAKKAEELTARLREEIATFDATKGAAERYKIAMLDIGATQRFELIGLTHQLDHLDEEKKKREELKKLEEKAAEARKQFLEEIETPQQKYNRLLKEAADLSINPAEFSQAEKHAREQAFGKPEEGLRLASGLDFSSQEARTKILEHRYGTGGEDHAAKTADSTGRTADAVEKIFDYFSRRPSATATTDTLLGL